MSALVELSWVDVEVDVEVDTEVDFAVDFGPESSGMMRLARTLPSSTPHWSKLFTRQIEPCTNTLCSYSAIMRPSMRGDSFSQSRVLVGRLPGKVRWGTSHAGFPSARTSAGVLPNARASPWAKMFAMRMSW